MVTLRAQHCPTDRAYRATVDRAVRRTLTLVMRWLGRVNAGPTASCCSEVVHTIRWNVHTARGVMRRSDARKSKVGDGSRPKKMPRTFRLTSGKVEAAQQILGADNATDAIETALDMVVFRRELMQGTEAAFGIRIASPDGD